MNRMPQKHRMQEIYLNKGSPTLQAPIVWGMVWIAIVEISRFLRDLEMLRLAPRDINLGMYLGSLVRAAGKTYLGQ